MEEVQTTSNVWDSNENPRFKFVKRSPILEPNPI
ncbi:uncharacterized protein METZ01_LOCUS221495 [marine metagenome]|uniref:Uncharacterized protein n=1 Tax=marine metagenome TaxID=408172 RepID=A0A382G374_9ZZZZ